MSYLITASIVTYQNNREVLSQAIKSFLNTTLNIRLFLIDNSPVDSLRDLVSDPRVEYRFNNKNVGFGSAHNIAMREAINLDSKYHVILNPDISFDQGVIENLAQYLDTHPDVGQAMPKVLYPDGQIQYLCKLLPAPADLLFRRFFPWFPGAERRNNRYELKASGYNTIMNIPYLSGCFMFIRTEALKEVGLFDERIFMYIEDADLTRRIHYRYQTIFFPQVSVLHHYAKGSYKSLKLMLYNLHGAIIYFSKWGWLIDSDRKQINARVIESYLSK
jgi:GT2 family glycosyltransferase